MNKGGHKDGFKKQAGTSLTKYFHMSSSQLGPMQGLQSSSLEQILPNPSQMSSHLNLSPTIGRRT